MAAGGQEVAFALLVQSALGTTASNNTGGADYQNMHLDELTEGPGYITDEGRPEIGGQLYAVSSSEKYGAAPFVNAQGKLRLEYLDLLLQAAGWNAGTPTGGYTPYVPVTTSAAFKYLTADVKYSAETGNQYQILDTRAQRLVLDFTPRQAPLFALDLVGGNHAESTADHVEYATSTVPSPVAVVPGANRRFFGTDSFKVYGFRFIIENIIDNSRQPLGQFTPDDVVAVGIASRVEALIQMSDASYRRLIYGGTGLTAASATKATGDMNVRIANGTKSVEFVYPTAEYFIGEPRPVRATEQVLLPVRARCTGTPEIRVDTT